MTSLPLRRSPLFAGTLALTFATVGCADAAPHVEMVGEGEGGSRWISGTVDERFQQVGDQMAGFSASMWEVAHRYRELHWAIVDENWAYADYQADKIAGAVERGIIRRPGRAESAREHFLGEPVDRFRAALDAGNADDILREYDAFTTACNDCHAAEYMWFIEVGPPAERSTVVQPGEGLR